MFVHYGAKHFDKSLFKVASNHKSCGFKPIGGLWGSPVETKYSWKMWCESNHFREYEPDNCFFFRLDQSMNWITIHSKDGWLRCPKRDDLKDEIYQYIDYEKMLREGVDGYPLYAAELNFIDYDEFYTCFPGHDCDSVVVLDDKILIENYDAKYSKKPLTLLDLLPMHPFIEIRDNIQVCCLCRSPEDKTYIYFEQPDIHYGFKTLVACITDGRIVEIRGYSEAEAMELIEEMKLYKSEIEEHSNGITT